MDLITTDNLEFLMEAHAEWCVSLFMPAHRVGRETEQDPTRFKNLLRQAEELLLAKGLRLPQARDLLEPALSLLKDPAFWRYQSDGLAVFASGGEFRFYRLPVRFDEKVVVADRFHVKPLLRLLTTDGHFYVLALSQNQAKLLMGTRLTVEEIEVENMPTSLAEVAQHDRLEQHLQLRTRTSSRTGDHSAVFHGHDIGDEAKGRILQWFHKIDDTVSPVLGGRQSPLVLASVDYLQPLYRQANNHPHLLSKGISGNPDEVSMDDLHDRAWAIVRHHFLKGQEQAAARYRELAGTGRTTTDVNEAVRAAHHGRVDALFVASGVQMWGSFDPAADVVQVHDELETGDVDLLDLTAVRTLLNGGQAYVVEPQQVPADGPLAAVFRY